MDERYFVGWQEPDGIQVAGASYQDEIYDRQAADPHAPLATCETAEDAARLVALLNRYEARLGALRGAAAAMGDRRTRQPLHPSHRRAVRRLARRRAGRQWLEEYRKLWRQTLRRRVRVSPNWWKVGS